MKIWTSAVVSLLAAFALIFSSGCVPTSGFTVGGKVSGLSGQVVLSLNGGEALTVAKNGAYKFTTRLETGAGYNVSIASQPAGQSCNLVNPTGPIGSVGVTNVNVVCLSNPYKVGGSVDGLQGNLTLSLNGSESISLSTNGEFLFSSLVFVGNAYNVSVATQPIGQNCAVINGDGHISTSDINAIAVSCQNLVYRVGGAIGGLQGDLNLMLNGTETLVLRNNGSYEFSTPLAHLASYDITASAQPAGQKCAIGGGIGQINAANAQVDIYCSTLAPVITHVWPGSVIENYEVKISGQNLDAAVALLNGVALKPTLQTSNEIRFIAPHNPKGIYLLELSNTWGSASQNITQGAVMDNIAAISTGDFDSCALNNNGEVMCWGDDNWQIEPNPQPRNPVMIGSVQNAVSISSGADHSCAVLDTGGVKCWGSNSFGQLGNGENRTKESTPVDVSGITNALSVSSGTGHTCAALSTGEVRCWGWNQFGQLGNGTKADSSIPMSVPGITNSIAVSAGGETHSCAVLATGVVQCWGNNYAGQLGDGTTIDSMTPVTVTGIDNAISVNSGEYFSCALLGSGAVKCWGANNHGQLGDGTIASHSTPVTVANLGNVVAITAGYEHGCALTNTGSVRCWGNNEHGQVGNNSTIDSSAPVAVSGLNNAVAVDAGRSHSCALLNSGIVKCWGSRSYLGSSLVEDSYTPITVTGVNNAVLTNNTCALLETGAVQCWDDTTQILGIGQAVALSASCAVLNSGSVKCWGWNALGQLGNGTKIDSKIPVTVSGITNAKSVSGGAHVCATLNTGLVQCWGWNTYGQLGNGAAADSSVPVFVAGINNAIDTSVGQMHSCALLRTGEVKCWGDNSHGQLGNSSSSSTKIPVLISGLKNAISLSSGTDHTCALLSSGVVYCWGDNGDGGLGNNTVGGSYSDKPVPVNNLDRVVAISAGQNRNCALVDTGVVKCWGYGYGYTPVTVAGISNAVSINTFGFSSCAVLDNGAVQCWGENPAGELSLPGEFSSQSSPGMPVYSR